MICCNYYSPKADNNLFNYIHISYVLCIMQIMHYRGYRLNNEF